MFRSKWSSTEQLVAQDWIEEASKKSRLGRHCGCCPRRCYSRCCVEAMYFYCGTICVLALILLLILALGIVAPFHRSLKYIPTRCTTLSTTFTGTLENCLCSGHHCQSTYPCVDTRVSYNTTEGQYEMAQVYNSQYDHGKCSFTPQCKRSGDKNKYTVMDFVMTYGTSNYTFDCLYNPADFTHVIRRRDGHHDNMFHMLLWPSTVALVAALFLIVPYLVCGCGFLWKRHPPTSIKQEAELRARGITLSEYSHMETTREEPGRDGQA